MPRSWLWMKVAWAAVRCRSNREFYDRIAPIYDELFVEHRIHALTIAQLLGSSFAGKEENTDVLDLGCGTGLLSRMLADRGYRVVGLDLSYESLRIFKSCNGRSAAVQADAEHLPFTGASFDSVVCLGTWRHFSNSQGVLNEVARALTRNGLFVIGYFPPAMAGAVHVGRGSVGRLLVSLYRLATRFLGYVDRADFELEEEAVASAKERFHTVRVIPSGKHSRVILATHPKITHSGGTQGVTPTLQSVGDVHRQPNGASPDCFVRARSTATSVCACT